MKHVFLALPATVLLAASAFAQTETTTTTEAATGTATGTASASGEFGTNWPLSVGTTFFTDADSATLRSSEELTKGWQSLSPEDQSMVRADCEIFLAAHGDAGADAATGTDASDGSSSASGTDTSADASASGEASDTSSDTATSTDVATSTDTAISTDSSTSGTDAATSVPAGYDMAEMKAICVAVGAL